MVTLVPSCGIPPTQLTSGTALIPLPPPHHMQDLEEAAEEQRAILQREQPMSNEQTPSQLRTVLQVRRVPSSDVSTQPAQRGCQTGSALAEPS